MPCEGHPYSSRVEEAHGDELGVAIPQELRAGGSRLRPSHPPRRPTRPTASPRRVGAGGAGAGEGRQHAQLAVGRTSGGRSAPGPSWTINWIRHPHDHLDGDGPFETLRRVVLQLLDLAAGLGPGSTLRCATQGVPAQDARGFIGAGHRQRRQHEPLQRLDPGRRVFLARVDDVQLYRLGAGARQLHRLVARVNSASRFARPSLAGCLLAFTRALSRRTSVAAPRAGPCAPRTKRRRETACPSAVFSRPRTRSDLRPDQQVDPRGVCGARRTGRGSPSRSIVHTTRVSPPNRPAASAQCAAPRNGTTSRSSPAAGLSPRDSGARARRTRPAGRPARLTARGVQVAARHRAGLIRADDPVPRSGRGRSSGGSRPGCTAPRCRSVRSRWGARMFTVTALSAGWSISR